MPATAHIPEDTLFDEITEALDENGTLTEQTRKRLMLMTIKEVYKNTRCLPDLTKRVEKLEEKNIWMWAEKHPKGAITIVLFFIMIVTAWGELSTKLLPLLGF